MEHEPFPRAQWHVPVHSWGQGQSPNLLTQRRPRAGASWVGLDVGQLSGIEVRREKERRREERRREGNREVGRRNDRRRGKQRRRPSVGRSEEAGTGPTPCSGLTSSLSLTFCCPAVDRGPHQPQEISVKTVTQAWKTWRRRGLSGTQGMEMQVIVALMSPCHSGLLLTLEDRTSSVSSLSCQLQSKTVPGLHGPCPLCPQLSSGLGCSHHHPGAAATE